MIALSVSEISTLDGFCDEDEQELGVLVVGYVILQHDQININVFNVTKSTEM